MKPPIGGAKVFSDNYILRKYYKNTVSETVTKLPDLNPEFGCPSETVFLFLDEIEFN